MTQPRPAGVACTGRRVVDAKTQTALTGDTRPAVAENTTSAVAACNGADPDSDTLTWSVNNDTFWISQRGRLGFASPPSFEDGNLPLRDGRGHRPGAAPPGHW